MPTISINLEYLYELLGKSLTLKEFDDLCFDYGLELEEDNEVEANVKVELPANRYDLLSVEGLALALRSYLEGRQVKHSVIDPKTIPNCRVLSGLCCIMSV